MARYSHDGGEGFFVCFETKEEFLDDIWSIGWENEEDFTKDTGHTFEGLKGRKWIPMAWTPFKATRIFDVEDSEISGEVVKLPAREREWE